VGQFVKLLPKWIRKNFIDLKGCLIKTSSAKTLFRQKRSQVGKSAPYYNNLTVVKHQMIDVPGSGNRIAVQMFQPESSILQRFKYSVESLTFWSEFSFSWIFSGVACQVIDILHGQFCEWDNLSNCYPNG